MTTKAAFSAEEWKAVLEGPPAAGMIVVTAARGGMFRESIAMSKAYGEARARHGVSPAGATAIQQIAAALGTPGP